MRARALAVRFCGSLARRGDRDETPSPPKEARGTIQDRRRDALVGLAVEAWRSCQVFRSVAAKLSVEDEARAQGRWSWSRRKLDEHLEGVGLRIVELAPGEPFDVGMAVTPLNVEDFDVHDELCIEQMIEPIIMEDGTVAKTGTVILRRKEA